MSISLNRRDLLNLSLRSVGGLSLASLLRLRATHAAQSPARDRTALIVVWLHGGASHLETYDPKPDSPAEYRGPYNSIATKTPGLRVCELLPRHAAISDKFTILRSMAHTGFCHQQGLQQLFTGHPIRELRNKPDHPDCLSIASYLRRDPKRAIPNYVGLQGFPYGGSAYLGPAFEPFAVNGNPNDKAFSVPNVGLPSPQQAQRLETTLSLRKQLDRMRRDLDLKGNMAALDDFEQQAWHMLSGTKVKEAFDLSQEKPETRERYGLTSWGQQLLLARRLVESGVDLVSTTLGGPEAGPVNNWDDHAVNHHVFDVMKHRAPNFDQCVTALIEDLYVRGLDRRVMLIVTGEFGRTPKISYAVGTNNGVKQPGRDHWPNATSLLFAGGGMRTGQVIGATDPRGEEVVERRVGVRDFLATIYRHLGIDPTGIAFSDFAGRPIPILPDGTPIPELAAV